MMRLVLSALALSVLAGCGIKGDLERPDPLWGSREAIARECARQAERGEPQDARCAEVRQPQQ